MSNPDFKTKVAGIAAICSFSFVFVFAQAVYERHVETRRAAERAAEMRESGSPGGHVEVWGDGTWSGAVRDTVVEDGPLLALVVLVMFTLSLVMPAERARAPRVSRRNAAVWLVALGAGGPTAAQSVGSYESAVTPDRWSVSADTLGWLAIPPDADADPEVHEAYGERLWRLAYPLWAYEHVRWTEVERDYDLVSEINPFLLYGDFDGDGRVDVAAWVREREHVERAPGELPGLAVVVVHAAGGAHVVPHQSAILPLWQLYPDREVGQGATEGPPPTLVGHALYFEKEGASSWVCYWDGETYETYWQGD